MHPTPAGGVSICRRKILLNCKRRRGSIFRRNILLSYKPRGEHLPPRSFLGLAADVALGHIVANEVARAVVAAVAVELLGLLGGADAVGHGDGVQLRDEVDDGLDRPVRALAAAKKLGHLGREHDVVHVELRELHHRAGVGAKAREHKVKALIPEIQQGAGGLAVVLLQQLCREGEAHLVGVDLKAIAEAQYVILGPGVL